MVPLRSVSVCLCPHLTSRMQVCPLRQAFVHSCTAGVVLLELSPSPQLSKLQNCSGAWHFNRARGSGDREWCWLYGFVGTPTAIGLNSKVVSMVALVYLNIQIFSRL